MLHEPELGDDDPVRDRILLDVHKELSRPFRSGRRRPPDLDHAVAQFLRQDLALQGPFGPVLNDTTALGYGACCDDVPG
jgi:hypothetical protein